MNVLFPGTEEIQKIQTAVFAGLADAQEDKVFLNSFRCRETFDGATKSGKRLDRVLGIVVVPRNAVMIQKSEQLVALRFQPSSAFHR